jgi:hypothetical protein
VQKNGQQTGKGLTNLDVTVGFLERHFIPGEEALDCHGLFFLDVDSSPSCCRCRGKKGKLALHRGTFFRAPGSGILVLLLQ